MHEYRGYQIARRRGRTCEECFHIFKNGSYISYAGSVAEAEMLIDTYISWSE